MNKTIRAWKDPAFRTTLDDPHLEAMSDSPVGAVWIPDGALAGVVGADHRPWTFHTCFTCNWSCSSCNTRFGTPTC